jgi:antitoxin (DNA-binding transcriptional repressor) of toxin-antitoxin stability system
VERAARGETFAISKAHQPLVRVTALGTPAQPRRLGFLAGEIAVPDDFDQIGSSEIETLFEGQRRA